MTFDNQNTMMHILHPIPNIGILYIILYQIRSFAVKQIANMNKELCEMK